MRQTHGILTMPIQTNARNSNNVFISINPDLGKHVGHYLGHERAINSVIRDRGDMHIVLCNKDVSDYIDCDFLLIPTFSCDHSANFISDRFENDFKTELLFSLFKVFNGIAPKNDCSIIVYMYLGSIKVASWICQLLSEIPSQLTARLQIHINCFNNIVNPNFQEIERDINIIKDSLAKGHIHLSIDTEYAKQNLLNRNVNEIEFRVWPMIATTDYSSLFNRSQYETSHVNNRKYSVFFPGTSQIAKGVNLSSKLCLKLSHENPSKHYAIRRSHHKIDANIVETFQKLETRDNVHIVDSFNSCVEYLETFLNSEVSCITYDPAYFTARRNRV